MHIRNRNSSQDEAHRNKTPMRDTTEIDYDIYDSVHPRAIDQRLPYKFDSVDVALEKAQALQSVRCDCRNTCSKFLYRISIGLRWWEKGYILYIQITRNVAICHMDR